MHVHYTNPKGDKSEKLSLSLALKRQLYYQFLL